MSFFRRKKVAAATNFLRPGAVPGAQPGQDPSLGPQINYGLSVTVHNGGSAKVLIAGQDPQLVELLAAGLRQDKRLLKILRESFRKANLPIK